MVYLLPVVQPNHVMQVSRRSSGVGKSTQKNVEVFSRSGASSSSAAQQGQMSAWTGGAYPQTVVPIIAPRPAPCVNDVDRTTLMLRNLPNNYTRAKLLDVFDREGLQSLYNFVYLPIDFQSRVSYGYAFLNLINHESAEKAMQKLQGFTHWKASSRKVLEVCWSDPHQGIEAHIERYRNSPVMHPRVPDEHKPVLFVGGICVPFPEPTKQIRPPRFRHLGAANSLSNSWMF